MTPDRTAEVREIIERVTRWAARRPDVVGLLLVGSYARHAARPDSDLDLVLLTTDLARYAGNGWPRELALGDPVRVRSWGPVTERRFGTASGLEVEICIGEPGWAGTDPVTPAPAGSSPTAPAFCTTPPERWETCSAPAGPHRIAGERRIRAVRAVTTVGTPRPVRSDRAPCR